MYVISFLLTENSQYTPLKKCNPKSVLLLLFLVSIINGGGSNAMIANGNKGVYHFFHLRINQRFGKKTAVPFSGKFLIEAAGRRGKHSGRDVFQSFVLLNAYQRFAAIHTRHINIEQNQARQRFLFV